MRKVYSEEWLQEAEAKVRSSARSTTQATRGQSAVTPNRRTHAMAGCADAKKPTIAAGSNPASSLKKKFDSKWEETYDAKLALEKCHGLIKEYWFHPFSLWLPGGVRYKPDFMIQYADQPGFHKDVLIEPRLEIIEVKGWSKNRRDGITRLKIAAALFPCFTWRMVYKTKGGGWDGEYI